MWYGRHWPTTLKSTPLFFIQFIGTFSPPLSFACVDMPPFRPSAMWTQSFSLIPHLQTLMPASTARSLSHNVINGRHVMWRPKITYPYPLHLSPWSYSKKQYPLINKPQHPPLFFSLIQSAPKSDQQLSLSLAFSISFSLFLTRQENGTSFQHLSSHHRLCFVCGRERFCNITNRLKRFHQIFLQLHKLSCGVRAVALRLRQLHTAEPKAAGADRAERKPRTCTVCVYVRVEAVTRQGNEFTWPGGHQGLRGQYWG